MNPQQLLSTIVRQTTAFPEHGWFTLVSAFLLFFCLLFFVGEITQVWNNMNYKVFNICRSDSESTNCCTQWSLRGSMWAYYRWEQVLCCLSTFSVQKGQTGVRGIITRQGEKKWSMQHACLWWINAVLHELMRDVRNMLRICYTQWSI